MLSFFRNADKKDATAFKEVVPLTGVYAVGDDRYTVNIIGGTGRFCRRDGELSITCVLDINQGKIVLRYQGGICFAQTGR